MPANDPLSDPIHDTPDGLEGSALYWLAVLRSARTSGDVLLESLARRRLVAMGCRVVFDRSHQAKGGKG